MKNLYGLSHFEFGLNFMIISSYPSLYIAIKYFHIVGMSRPDIFNSVFRNSFRFSVEIKRPFSLSKRSISSPALKLNLLAHLLGIVIVRVLCPCFMTFLFIEIIVLWNI